MAVRVEVFRRELYRNPKPSEFGVDLWRSDALSWPNALLMKFGHWLIAVGTRLKNAAQPRAAFSQEML